MDAALNAIQIPLGPITGYNRYIKDNGIISVKITENIVDITGLSMAS